MALLPRWRRTAMLACTLLLAAGAVAAQTPSLKEILERAQSERDAIAVEGIVKGLKKEPATPQPGATPAARSSRDAEAARLEAEAAKARADAEAALVRAEAEAAKVRADAETARLKANAEAAKARADAEAAKVRADAEAVRLRAEAEAAAKAGASAEAARLEAEAATAAARASAEAEAAAAAARASAEAAAARREAEAKGAARARAEAEAARVRAEAAATRAREDAEAARRRAEAEARPEPVAASQPPSIDLQILFDYDKATISEASYPVLVQLGRALTDPRLANRRILIAGHTDGKGNADYNLALSERRAQAVRAALIENFKIPEHRLLAIGYGKQRLRNPQNPLATENRRVEIVNLSELPGR